jgi:hypothetical protein
MNRFSFDVTQNGYNQSFETNSFDFIINLVVVQLG